VLGVLLHKGPLPVDTIGPIVDLTPASISIAVGRLVAKGLVSRVESTEDRRVRMVVSISSETTCFLPVHWLGQVHVRGRCYSFTGAESQFQQGRFPFGTATPPGRR
jgi:hypothetical protein